MVGLRYGFILATNTELLKGLPRTHSPHTELLTALPDYLVPTTSYPYTLTLFQPDRNHLGLDQY